MFSRTLLVTLLASAPTLGLTQGGATERPDTDEQRIADLVVANHILSDEGILDGLGHISVRSVKNPKHYYMSRSRSAGGVSLADVMEFDDESRPVDQQGRPMYGERFIHGEIYKARPDVQAVVHAHTTSVLPFTVTDAPFQAVIHMAAFIGDQPAPVFEIRDVEGENNRLLVTNAVSGAALARTLGNRTVALMRGHGLVVVADTYPGGPARWIADRAYFVHVNAQVLAEAMRLGRVKLMNAYEAKWISGGVDRWWEEYSARAEANARHKQ